MSCKCWMHTRSLLNKIIIEPEPSPQILFHLSPVSPEVLHKLVLSQAFHREPHEQNTASYGRSLLVKLYKKLWQGSKMKTWITNKKIIWSVAYTITMYAIVPWVRASWSLAHRTRPSTHVACRRHGQKCPQFCFAREPSSIIYTIKTEVFWIPRSTILLCIQHLKCSNG
jgi:hypothetical protein